VLDIMSYKGKFLVAFPPYAAYFQTDDPLSAVLPPAKRETVNSRR